MLAACCLNYTWYACWDPIWTTPARGVVWGYTSYWPSLGLGRTAYVVILVEGRDAKSWEINLGQACSSDMTRAILFVTSLISNMEVIPVTAVSRQSIRSDEGKVSIRVGGTCCGVSGDLYWSVNCLNCARAFPCGDGFPDKRG